MSSSTTQPGSKPSPVPAAPPSDPLNSQSYRYPPSTFSALLSVGLLGAIALVFLLAVIRAFALWARSVSGAQNSNSENAPAQQAGSGPSGRQQSSRGPTGLDASLIRSFPTVKFTGDSGRSDASVDEQRQSHKDCPVCLAEYETGDVIKTLPSCGHFFHASCIDSWLSAKTTCPLCRIDLQPSSPTPPLPPGDSGRSSTSARFLGLLGFPEAPGAAATPVTDLARVHDIETGVGLVEREGSEAAGEAAPSSATSALTRSGRRVSTP